MASFSLQPEKLKAALLYICQLQGGECDKYAMLKILYFAERQHLAQYGRPITGDSYSALPYGPVPSYAYDAVKGSNSLSSSFAATGRYSIKGLAAPDMDEFSDSDIECIEAAVNYYGEMGFSDLKSISHDTAYKTTPEKAYMSYLEIALAGGATSDMLDYIKLISENNICELDVPTTTE